MTKINSVYFSIDPLDVRYHSAIEDFMKLADLIHEGTDLDMFEPIYAAASDKEVKPDRRQAILLEMQQLNSSLYRECFRL